ncbi:hypothetical protein [Pedobacter xixiisoli]|uniref:HD domain-containing protein n=1 Tax=Pedobacter xixiisoli TaxID=1476464 RepID=UPI00197F4FA4|nr:hypothetical protein [Pedobacter xixiisoli]
MIEELWDEIEIAYSGQQRYYHSLTHLENLLAQLEAIAAQLQNWDVILFSLYYHDIIYSATQSNNEEKSAELAENRMLKAGIPLAIIKECKEQILATKSHVVSNNHDTNYFTDADLSILGQDWDSYAAYFKSVRKEYQIFPNLIYKVGRKKVLKHFLTMPRIYKTAYFYEKLESKARENLQKEIDLL